MPCFEIVDSRIDNWDIKVCDTIADNASCGVFVLGTEPKDPLELDLALVGMTIDVRRPGDSVGELFATGAGAAVKGSPINSMIWLANTLAALGIPCRAGEVILTGSLSMMAWVKGPQTITCEFGGLGSCTAFDDSSREHFVALSASVISELADIVDGAQRNAADIVKLTDAQPDMDVADGYAVQAEICRRWQADGRRLTGYKGGLTSKAKMVQMGLDTPVFGVLMGDTCVPDGDVVDMSSAHPPEGRSRDRLRHRSRIVG